MTAKEGTPITIPTKPNSPPPRRIANIGAVPSTILIMIDTPIKGIYFIIFILLLQQFDGNILGPKILGDSTGLSAFWVIVAILPAYPFLLSARS